MSPHATFEWFRCIVEYYAFLIKIIQFIILLRFLKCITLFLFKKRKETV